MAVGFKREHAAWSLEDSLDELEQLAKAAGANVIGRTTQQLEGKSFTYLGKGKLAELVDLHRGIPFDTLIIDDELTPTQQRNIELAFSEQVKVIDRTALILDLFARHARTREGALQVSLAQSEYLLPRLAGQWSHLERLGGGIGTRGPGETQIETDRRLVNRRILRLKKEIEKVRNQRYLHRARRSKVGIEIASLVGYTNAGKSSLLNALTMSDVAVRNQPFSTLDPITRRVRLPGGRSVLLTDTVGFIQKLPMSLVASFRATLEQLSEAKILIHIVDITHQNASNQVEVVEKVLSDLQVDDKPRLIVMNKADLLGDEVSLDLLERMPGPSSVLTSAQTGLGLNRLLIMLEKALESLPVDPKSNFSPKSALNH